MYSYIVFFFTERVEPRRTVKLYVEPRRKNGGPLSFGVVLLLWSYHLPYRCFINAFLFSPAVLFGSVLRLPFARQEEANDIFDSEGERRRASSAAKANKKEQEEEGKKAK